MIKNNFFIGEEVFVPVVIHTFQGNPRIEVHPYFIPEVKVLKGKVKLINSNEFYDSKLLYTIEVDVNGKRLIQCEESQIFKNEIALDDAIRDMLEKAIQGFDKCDII